MSAAEITTAVAELKGGLPPGEALTGEKIAEHLVKRGTITRWQADQLLQGRYRGFFLKNYKLLSLLGSGGMSNVYVAEHLLLGRRVAIKVLPLSRVKDRAYLERFYQEARAAARVDHPNIVRAYDVENEGDVHFLVMEYVPGCDLATLVKREGPLDYCRAAEYIRQAAVGLEAAHRAGLVHRDIKPGNLLVDQNNVVKILDLGLALLTAGDDSRASLTMENEDNVLGTADYIAPEQALNSHQVDCRADIYSLGCSLFFLLTGHPPFDRGSVAQRLLAHIRQQPPNILQERPDVPPELADICARMMAKKPEDRPQSAQEVAILLEAFLTQHAGGTPKGGEFRQQEGCWEATPVSTGMPSDAPSADSRARTADPKLSREQGVGSAATQAAGSSAVIGISGAGAVAGRGSSARVSGDRMGGGAPQPGSGSSGRLGVSSSSAGSGSSSGRALARPAEGSSRKLPLSAKGGPLGGEAGSAARSSVRGRDPQAAGAPASPAVSEPSTSSAGAVQDDLLEVPVLPVIEPTRPKSVSAKRYTRRSSNPLAEVPWGIWVTIAGGMLLAIILALLLFSRR
jgi:serine/threonine-protein kinase